MRTASGSAAPSFSTTLTIQSFGYRGREFEHALQALVRERVGALIVPAVTHNVHGRRIAEVAAKTRLPVFSLSDTAVERHFGLAGVRRS